MKKLKSNNGITLVALIITVIVMMILAGATVYMIMNGDNLFDKVREVVERWNLSTKKNQDELTQLEKDLNENAIIAQSGTKADDLLNKDGIKIGEKILDGKGGIVPVPEGFYYVGGTIGKGAVISDAPVDKNKYKGQENVGKDLQGNQFVFVPADGENLEYKQDHTYTNKQYEYTNYIDWQEDEVNETENAESVQTYGGFYIGRYEAGWPDEITEGKENSSKNNSSKTPISKAGVASWNLVSQKTAKMVSQNMYGTGAKVKSKLVDSYAWDTTCKWLKNSGIDVESSAGYGNYTNSNFTVEDTVYSEHMFLTAKEGSGKPSNWLIWLTDDNGKTHTENYNIGSIQVGKKTGVVLPEGFKETEYTAEKRIEIATGSTAVADNGEKIEKTRTNNIYDLAGNMYEWTTETGNHKKSDGTVSTNPYAVLRGGSFNNDGSESVVYHNGGTTAGDTYILIGFRVVLYIK